MCGQPSAAGLFCQALNYVFVPLPGCPAPLLSQCSATLEMLLFAWCALVITRFGFVCFYFLFFFRRGSDLSWPLCCEQRAAYTFSY